MIEANPTPKHHFDDKPIGLHRCTKPSKHSLFQQPASDAKEVSGYYYETNWWGNAESLSGAGSSLQYTENIRKKIPQIVEEFGIY